MITSYFGERVNPIDGSPGEYHKGIDIALNEGTPLAAACDGVVTEAEYSSSWGYHIRYRTEEGDIILYAHLKELSVDKGDGVHKGDIIGYSGNTGSSTGPHLHIGVYRRGQEIDPMEVGWVY